MAKIKFQEEYLGSKVEKSDDNFVAIIVDVSSHSTTRRVVFHEKGVDEIETFKDFVENVCGEFSCEDVNVEENEKDFWKMFDNKIVEGKDFDEESGAEWSTYSLEGVLVVAYNGFDWSNVEEAVKKACDKFDESEKEIIGEHIEAEEERADPYKYRGVSRSDFF